MLTIKHIDTDGTETLLEAERIEVVQGKGQFEDGIFLDPDYGDQVIGRSTRSAQGAEIPAPPVGAVPYRTFRHVIHFVQARSSMDCEPRVYIMNRFGATVATYRL